MEKLSNENKKVFLIGNFNVDLMKIDIDVDASNLIDIIYSNSVQFEDGISGNRTIFISDHLPNF